MYEVGSGSAPGATIVGAVKWCDPVKGFGFLAPADGSREVFCHAPAVSNAGWLTLPEGAVVTCEIEQGRRGPQVRRIHAVDATAASPGGSEGRGAPRVERAHGESAIASSRRTRLATQHAG